MKSTFFNLNFFLQNFLFLYTYTHAAWLVIFGTDLNQWMEIPNNPHTSPIWILIVDRLFANGASSFSYYKLFVSSSGKIL